LTFSRIGEVSILPPQFHHKMTAGEADN